ncbi:tetratricopeptide repeat protein [Microcoleus sp. AR_TQ3_B6]|uniref:tetratricopeptide repeat protein n=1 Tax=Microcoleus sp. AR_TQ3_B6 TaxID=3055284 RepID=UPI002FD5C57C
MQKNFIKSIALAIVLACHGCIEVNSNLPQTEKSASPQQVQTLEEKYKRTCYADALTESEGRKITEKSNTLETAADKLAAAGKHKEAIRKYHEAGAAALNETIADGTVEEMENFTGDAEDFRAKNRPLIQRTAELNFKVGQSYAQLGKLESALDCFNRTLKVGILPPNDAITYLNRGDVYERMGSKEKAKADFRQAANLFKKHKLVSYQKDAEKRLQNLIKVNK